MWRLRRFIRRRIIPLIQWAVYRWPDRMTAVLDLIGERHFDQFLMGHGNIGVEIGWLVFGEFVKRDEPDAPPIRVVKPATLTAPPGWSLMSSDGHSDVLPTLDALDEHDCF